MRRMYDENEIKSIASEAGGGKLYMHNVEIKSANSYELPTLKFRYINKSNLPLSKSDLEKAQYSAFNLFLNGDDTTTVPPSLYIAQNFNFASNYIEVFYLKNYPGGDDTNVRITGDYTINDTVTEL